MKKGFAPILILLLLALALATIGSAAYLQLKPKTPSQNLPIPSPSTSHAPNGTGANWKTYTNQELGFTVKYSQSLLTIDREGVVQTYEEGPKNGRLFSFRLSSRNENAQYLQVFGQILSTFQFIN